MTAFQPNPEKLTAQQELGGGLDSAYEGYLARIGAEQVVSVSAPIRHYRRSQEPGDSGFDPNWNVIQDRMSSEEKVKRITSAHHGRQLASEVFARIMDEKAQAEADETTPHLLTAGEIKQAADESWDEIEQVRGDR